MTTFLSIWHEVNHFTSFFKLYVFFLLSIPSSPTTHTLAAATKLPNANSTLQAGCVELYSTGIFLSLQKYSLSFPLSLSLSHTHHQSTLNIPPSFSCRSHGFSDSAQLQCVWHWLLVCVAASPSLLSTSGLPSLWHCDN